MSIQDDLTPTVRSWLQDQTGPLSDDVREWVLGRVPSTRQRRTRWPELRFPVVAATRLALAAVIVIALGIGLLPQRDDRPGGAGVTSPSPSPSPSAAMPTARDASQEIPGMGSGRYLMPEPNTDGVGAWPARVVVTVPAGWTQRSVQRGGALSKPSDASGDPSHELARLAFGRPGSLTQDGPAICPSPSELPVGRTVDELLSELESIADIEVADLSIAGFLGKRVDLAIPIGSPMCRGPFGWHTPGGGEAWGYEWEPGWHYQLAILDIEGVRFLIDAGYRLDAPPEVRAEVEAMVDSIELVVPSPDPSASPLASTP